MNRVENLPLNPTPEMELLFRVTFLETRVKELEHIVHAVLKDRIGKDDADAWLEACHGPGFTPTVKAVEDRGQRIVSNLDRWPEAQKWPDKPEI